MLSNIIAKLKDPELVWQFQYYFGIRGCQEEASSNAFHTGGRHGEKPQANATHIPNGCSQRNNVNNKHNGNLTNNHNHHVSQKIGDETVKSGSKVDQSSTTSTTTEEDDSESNSSESASSDRNINHNNHQNSNKRYQIVFPFWYHLFSFGAALGDEAFYVSFFPFWFWNIGKYRTISLRYHVWRCCVRI